MRTRRNGYDAPLLEALAEVARLDYEDTVTRLDEVRADLVPAERAAPCEEEDGAARRGVHDLAISRRDVPDWGSVDVVQEGGNT